MGARAGLRARGDDPQTDVNESKILPMVSMMPSFMGIWDSHVPGTAAVSVAEPVCKQLHAIRPKTNLINEDCAEIIIGQSNVVLSSFMMERSSLLREVSLSNNKGHGLTASNQQGGYRPW